MSQYESCPECAHVWHGLACAVKILGDLGRPSWLCGCPPRWADPTDGEIGEPVRRRELEPVTVPVPEPVPEEQPAEPVREPEPVPA